MVKSIVFLVFGLFVTQVNAMESDTNERLNKKEQSIIMPKKDFLIKEEELIEFDVFNNTFESIIITHQQCHNCTKTMAAFSVANYWLRNACLNGNASNIMTLQHIPTFTDRSVKSFLLGYVEHYGSRMLIEDMPDERSRLFVERELNSARAFLDNPDTNAEIIWGEDDGDFAPLEAIIPQKLLEDYTGDKLLLGAPTSDLTNEDWYTVDIIKGNQNLIADLRRKETYDYITQRRPQGFARVLDERCYNTVSETIRRNAAALTAPGGIFCAQLRSKQKELEGVKVEFIESGFSSVLLGDQFALQDNHGMYYDKHMSVVDLINAFESAKINLGLVISSDEPYFYGILAIK